MFFHLGSGVRQREGQKLGELRRIGYDPETQQIAYLVVEHSGFEGPEVLVPIDAVQSADDDAVYLELSQEQFDGLEDYDDTRNIAPPPDADHMAVDEIQDPFDVPDVPPVGAATGIESIGFTPVVEETVHLPPGEQVIDSGSSVWATDGKIGHVRDVLVSDETDRITSLVVESGWLFLHDTEIPFEWVANVRPETIILNVDRATVEASAEGE
jgi:sporulation protein YlmC with PRC-barrel domain